MSEARMHTPTTVADWTAMPLGSGGRSLIEASAGTGKTWTISVLYLRLLLEASGADAEPLGPRQIVVTTFTDAAAQELRARLRERLAWAEQLALNAITAGTVVIDADTKPDRAWLLRRWSGNATRVNHDLRRLRLAQAELDLAPITTLHGLCRRILGDYPFESGGAFAPGDMVSTESLLDELAEDLWRRLQQAPGADARRAPASLSALRRRLASYLTPGVELWTPDAAEIARWLPVTWAAPIEGLAARRDIWGRKTKAPHALVAFAAFLRDHAQPFSAKQLADLSAAVDVLGQCTEQVARDAAAFVETSLRVVGYVAAAPEIEAWQRWTARVREWRDERLAARGQLTFDELITRVHGALSGASRSLADRLFAEWPVALVDEFQDTDAQQYAILDRIYRDAAAQPRGRLVMIGDPKQAIYRFRGGDIDAYLAASAVVDTRLELDTNYRSSRAYVAAINELYAQAGAALSADPAHPIRYHAVKSSDRGDEAAYRAPDEGASRTLVLHYNAEAPDAVGRCRELALKACANQIAQMLHAGTHHIGDEPLAPEHLAVLLPNNSDITTLRRLLQARHVPCVGAGKSSVFDTDWARDLQVVLYAVEHAHDGGAVRAALATRLGGMDFAQLRALRDDPNAWHPHAQRFESARRRWQRDGVLAVVLDFAAGALRHLPEPADRERALTDLRHLGELLQEQDERMQGAEQLLAWLAAQRRGEGDDAGDAADERQLRIESDAKRVRLMTLHASKGLEFPIVFLPLMWAHRSNGQDTTPVIHETLCDRRVVGFGEAAKAQYLREGQDERFRVLYVALTRAIHACHVYALSPQRPLKAGSANPATDPERAALDAVVERLQQHASTRGEPVARAFEHLRWSEGWPWRSVRYRTTAEAIAAPPRVLTEPGRPLYEQTWSFSTLTRSSRSFALEDEPADDEVVAADDSASLADPLAPEPASGLVEAKPHAEIVALGALRGAEFGNALHAIFENRRIGEPLRTQTARVERSLREAGVPLGDLPVPALVARIAERLDATLSAELAPGLRLAAVPVPQQRAEMAFHFVLDAVSVARLREACERRGMPGLVPERIPATTLRGLMTGKIDLVFEHDGRFHVLDYKSNHLGDRLADYAPTALTAAMDAHDYRFQALLYTVAVDRYLRQRVPNYERDRHLGEAVYLFVRAVGLAPGAGVWRHRFDSALLDAVDHALGDRPDQEAA
ncbi:UvrD-helicase domain-containing protein [Dokdonella soli]|uniref:RecBCD enzyme subunit RecB n=1 Tax=Dokdonella soli TaxID=529810 RepID=A0ABP3TVD3_9GAMM